MCFKWPPAGFKLLQVGLMLASSWVEPILEASLELLDLEKTYRKNCFSTFFKLLAVCFKWLQVGSSWPQVGSSWPQVDSSWPHVGSSWLHVGSSWPQVAVSWPQVWSS